MGESVPSSFVKLIESTFEFSVKGTEPPFSKRAMVRYARTITIDEMIALNMTAETISDLLDAINTLSD